MTGLWLGEFHLSQDDTIGCLPPCGLHTEANGFFLASFSEQSDGTFAAANSNACAVGTSRYTSSTSTTSSVGKGQIHILQIVGLRTANHILNYTQAISDTLSDPAHPAGSGIALPLVKFDTPDVKGTFDGQTVVFPPGKYTNAVGEFTVSVLKLTAIDTDDQYTGDCAALLK
jgi:hypothetical protein